jgi:hypothetical protein
MQERAQSSEARGDEIGSSRIGFRMRWRLLSTTGSVLSKEFGTMNLRWGLGLDGITAGWRWY